MIQSSHLWVFLEPEKSPQVFTDIAVSPLKLYSQRMPESSKNSPVYDERPWGNFTVLDEAATYKVKRIEVLPQKRLSYQKHTHRSEHWMVVHGSAKVTLDGREITVNSGETVDVPAGAAHRIENVGSEKLIFIEIQRGTYLGEDDIQRLQDDYGRG
jgi:mannose-6-phosphate isomerase